MIVAAYAERSGESSRVIDSLGRRCDPRGIGVELAIGRLCGSLMAE